MNLKKYFNLLALPIIAKLKNKLWHFMTTSKLQRQLEGKDKIIDELDKMSDEKIKKWKDGNNK